MAHYDGHVEAAREQYIAKLEVKVRELERQVADYAEQLETRDAYGQMQAKISDLEAKLRQIEEEQGGEVLFGQLCSRLIRHITSTDAKCDPPTDIELRLVSIIRERDQAREALRAITDNLRQKYPPGSEMFKRYIRDEDWWTSGRANNDFECWFVERALGEG